MLSRLVQFHRRHRWLSWGFGVFAVLIILISVAIALIPVMARWAVVDVMAQQGYQVSIGQLDLDLLDDRLELGQIQAQDAHGTEFSLAQVSIRIHWKALFDQQIRLDDVTISGLALQLSGLPVAGQAGGTQPAAPQQTNPQQTTPVADTAAAADPSTTHWEIQLAQLQLNQVEVCYTGQPQQYCLYLDKLHWQGALAYQIETPASVLALPLQLQGNLQLGKLRIHHPQTDLDLLTLANLSLAELKLSTLEAIEFKAVKLEQLRLLRSKPAEAAATEPAVFWAVQQLEAAPVVIRNFTDIEIGKARLEGSGARLVRTDSGEWELVRRIREVLPATSPSTPVTPQPGSGNKLHYRVNEFNLQLTDTWTFTDYTYKTPFKLNARSLQLNLQQLDNRAPQQASPLRLEAELQKHARLELSGSISPFRDKPTFDLNGKFTSVDLRPLTSQLERYLGYRVKSGQLEGSLVLTSNDGNLQGQADVELQQLTLVEVRAQTAEELEQQLGLPLNSALSLLREKDNSIHLKVPVSGNIADPKFSLNDAIKQLTVKAINEAVTNYYTDYGLAMAGYGQYSMVIKGASKLYGFLSKLRFENVVYAAGVSKLNTDHKAYLDKLAKMLISRPQVHLTLCGFVTRKDLLAQEPWMSNLSSDKQNVGELTERRAEKLLELADERADNIKDYLVRQWSIDAKRLIVCEPEYDMALEGVPRVAISI